MKHCACQRFLFGIILSSNQTNVRFFLELSSTLIRFRKNLYEVYDHLFFRKMSKFEYMIQYLFLCFTAVLSLDLWE